jgi:aminomethyltransferase
LKKIIGPDIAGLDYYTFKHFNLLGERIIVSRTGYTGELGYEIYISSGKVEAAWKLILGDNRVKPAGLGARDTLRLEMCYPLYGQDITTETTPFEAGMKRFVDTKKDFIGKAALLQKKTDRQFIYFTANSRRAPRHNYRIVRDGKDIGVVTSGSFSPSLSVGIGMGYVTAACPAGTAIVLKENDVEIQAIVTEKPFYKNGTAKKSEEIHANA